ncbi:class I SAM-dependent methyltransferase [Ruminococcaceae bacterium OttesenSCG-928-D13]|nr:class I SAM-dependent methyltransferase [Ruminococcaceae bacterium OttesenSCG-928-D13]
MLKALLRALEPPVVFEPNTEPFWDDDHISKQMLAAHLDPAFSGASRTPGVIDASVAFIANTMPPAEYPRLWDFGCGPGLYTSRLARLGYAATGLDLSRRSIAFAAAQAELDGLAISYRRENYLELDAHEVCDAAILIYCDYGALSPENRGMLMGNIHRALAPGGHFLLDVFTPAKLAGFREEQSWRRFPAGGFWSEKPHLALQNNLKYPGRVSLEQTVVLTEGEMKTTLIWNQYFTPQALAKEAEAAGFTVLALYGDAAGAPYAEDGETLALLLEKPR